MNLHTIRSDYFRQVFTNWWVYWKLEMKSFSNLREWWDIAKINIFYEMETSSTGLYSRTGGGRSPFWRKTFKNDGKFGFGSPILPPLLRESGSASGLL